MACACGNKSNGTRTTYVVKSPDGSTKTYSTELEAKAAALRVHGTWRAQ
jgi:hypothetical protein